MRIPKKIYHSPTLSSSERFHLLLRASGRSDDAEFERLLRTTPQKAYDTQDRAVIDKLEAAERIATTFVVLALEYARYIGAIYLDGFRTNTHVHHLALEEVKHYKSLKRTFDLFCDEINISPIDLLSLHPCGIREYSYISDFPPANDESIEIDQTFYDAMCNVLK